MHGSGKQCPVCREDLLGLSRELATALRRPDEAQEDDDDDDDSESGDDDAVAVNEGHQDDTRRSNRARKMVARPFDPSFESTWPQALSSESRVRPKPPSQPEWQEHIHGAEPHDDICSICEKGGNLVCCEGKCCRAFHATCVGPADTTAEPFVCPSCTKGVERCLLCHEESPLSEMVRCVVPGCGICFHKKCAPELMSVKRNGVAVRTGNTLVCPRHMCVTCDDVAISGESLVVCIRCPVGYHKHCVPAGSAVTGRNIICPKHKERPETEQAWNVDCCIACGEGGDVTCCDTCIGAYHYDCVKNVEGFDQIKSDQSGLWHCPECSFGLKPPLGALVWVKVPSLPLWPGQIVNDAPPSVGIGPGSFQVRLFGLTGQGNELHWVDLSDVGQWQVSDELRQHLLDDSGAAGFAEMAKALQEAKEACDAHGAKPVRGQAAGRETV